MWQQWRDEAAWVNSSSESELNRAHNVAIAALERSTDLDLADANKTSKLLQLLGRFGISITNDRGNYVFFDSVINIGKGVKDFFGSDTAKTIYDGAKSIYDYMKENLMI